MVVEVREAEVQEAKAREAEVDHTLEAGAESRDLVRLKNVMGGASLEVQKKKTVEVKVEA